MRFSCVVSCVVSCNSSDQICSACSEVIRTFAPLPCLTTVATNQSTTIKTNTSPVMIINVGNCVSKLMSFAGAIVGEFHTLGKTGHGQL